MKDQGVTCCLITRSKASSNALCECWIERSCHRQPVVERMDVSRLLLTEASVNGRGSEIHEFQCQNVGRPGRGTIPSLERNSYMRRI